MQIHKAAIHHPRIRQWRTLLPKHKSRIESGTRMMTSKKIQEAATYHRLPVPEAEKTDRPVNLQCRPVVDRNLLNASPSSQPTSIPEPKRPEITLENDKPAILKEDAKFPSPSNGDNASTSGSGSYADDPIDSAKIEPIAQDSAPKP